MGWHGRLVRVTWVLAVSAWWSACALPREGTLDQNCTLANQCDDANPCTDDGCSSEGVCEHLALPDAVLDDALQVEGDCLLAWCIGGAPIALDDTGDVYDDANDCTADSCGPTGPVNAPRAPDEPCTDTLGHPGVCVAVASDPAGLACRAACTADDQSGCDDADACTEDGCDVIAGLCSHAPLNGVPAGPQTPGDCGLVVCSNGVATAVVDGGDLPVDGNPCTDDLCSEGTAQNPPFPVGADCGGGHACDGAGTCVECVFDGDCPADTFCRDYACQNHVCVHTDRALSSALPAVPQFPGDPLDIAGDCHGWACDGLGGATLVIDDGDTPDDGRECTTDLCQSGVPANPPVPALPPQACQGGTCDGGGSCIGCTLDADCPADTFCRDYACVAGACTLTVTNVGVALPSGQTPGDCRRLACDAGGHVVSAADDADAPLSDGQACTFERCLAGVPVFGDEPIDTACETTRYCDGAGACVDCNRTVQCDPTGCQCSVCTLANTCSVAPPGSAAVCQTAGDCHTKECDGSGGTTNPVHTADIPVDTSQCTLDLCAANGTPSNPNAPDGTACSQDGGQVCDKGGCVQCRAAGDCAPNEACVSNTCKLVDGETCSAGADCKSTFCVDAICCKDACAALCKACDVAGALGTCTDVPTDQTPDAECAAGQSCIAHACKLVDGEPCSANNTCVSNVCKDGVCCGSPCNAADCEACVQSKTGVPDGTCAPIVDGTDPDNDCPGSQCCFAGVCGGSGC